MKRSCGMLVVAATLALVGCSNKGDPEDTSPGWELKPPGRDAAPVTAKERMPGIYPAGSRIKDRNAFGGFGAWDNYPKNLVGQEWGTKGPSPSSRFPRSPSLTSSTADSPCAW